MLVMLVDVLRLRLKSTRNDNPFGFIWNSRFLAFALFRQEAINEKEYLKITFELTQ